MTGTAHPGEPRQRRWLFLSGLRYNALYRQDEWLRDFLQEPSARSTLFRWRFSAIGVVVLLISALLAVGLGWLFGFVFALGVLAVSGIALWRALPGMITKEQASLREVDPFDPSTARIWRRRRGDR
jgi:hypothetical protein